MATSHEASAVHVTGPRSAAELGLASLLMGGFLAALAMMTLQMNLQMFLGPKGWSPRDLQLMQYAAIGGCFVFGGLTATSIAFGWLSISHARQHAQSSALGWAGLLISSLALLLWIGTLADLFSVLDMLQRGYPIQVLDSLQRSLPAMAK